MKKRVLIVNCYFDELRLPVRRRSKIPQAMTPAFLAGMFSRKRCDIRLYNEQYSGPLESGPLLEWPHMLVLTGLNTAFDRMLHLTAYARSVNPAIIVAAGGPAIRALFHYSRLFFDYSCTGDVEQLQEVIEDAFGKAYVSEQFLRDGWAVPRFDLVYWIRSPGYVESSRNCYNRCTFCSLTAESHAYRPYDIEYLRRQFLALGKRRIVVFLDNNFGSGDKKFIRDRFDLLQEMHERGYFWYWCALVSSEFLHDAENLRRAHETGCLSLFTGVESFDRDALADFQKYQNMRRSQPDTIRRCLEAHITFYYGMVYDIASRRIADLKREIEFMVSNSYMTLPSYISLAIPILKTPFFYECLDKGLLLPDVKIRDLDSTAITLKPLDPMPEVLRFVRDIQGLIGFRRKVLKHSARFYINNRKNLAFWHMVLALHNGLLLCTPTLATARPDYGRISLQNLRRQPRTYVATTEPLDPTYRPAFRVDSRFSRYFLPTMLTDGEGNLTESLRPDLARPAKGSVAVFGGDASLQAEAF